MARVVSIAAAVVCFGLGLAAAPVASADGADFVNYLGSNDPTFDRDEAYDAIDIGYLTCQLLETQQQIEELEDRPGTPVSRTLDFMTAADGGQQSLSTARIWLSGAVAHLCPELTK
jgi:hypothetical protein